MYKIYSEVVGTNVVIYNNEQKEVELGLLPVDSTKEEWLTFFDALGKELDVPLPANEAPYCANDIFNPDGTIRGIKIVRDARSVRTVSYVANGRLVARINRSSKSWYSELAYLLLKILIEFNIPETSITAMLVKVSLNEMMKPKRG